MNVQAARRIRNLEMQPDKVASGTTIDIRGMAKSFGGRPVLKGISLAIADGQFVAVIGRSGCGKTTLLRLLADLEKPEHGSITFDGADHRKRINDARVVFQEPRLLPWRSVHQNVAIGLDTSGHDRARITLQRVGLAGREDDWPSVLSGGQRQRVALARALVHAPRLLLLDEPFGALDALTRLEMHALLEELWRGLGFTALIVTHDVGEAVMLADRVIVLDDGGIALDLEVSLGRPRLRDDPRVGRFETQLLKCLLQA